MGLCKLGKVSRVSSTALYLFKVFTSTLVTCFCVGLFWIQHATAMAFFAVIGSNLRLASSLNNSNPYGAICARCNGAVAAVDLPRRNLVDVET